MSKTFQELNLNAEILTALTEMGFTEPTAIQAEVIPYVYAGRDCLAQAPTGTGKTCAFGIPILSKIDVNNPDIQVLIMCPTRELAMQTEAELKKVSKYIQNAKVLAIYGGQNIERQLAGLRRKPQIVVGTPGRIMDHLRKRTLKLDNIKTLVLDEADEMLNMGFREDIDVILSSTVMEHQTVLFSATMPKEILEISKLYQKNPMSVKTTLLENDLPPIAQYYIKVAESKKADALLALMKENNFHLVLVFCNTKRKVDELNSMLNSCDFVAEALHGDLRQRERDMIMKRYRGGDINILVATDVAARGIDVEGIEAVFNYDIPRDTEYYVHRIGRTARANKSGISYSFIAPQEAGKIKEIERYTKTKMTEMSDPNRGKVMATEERKLQMALKELSGNLAPFMKLIKEKLDSYNETSVTPVGMLELAAALLKADSSYEEPTVSGRDTSATGRDKSGSKEASLRRVVRGDTKNSIRYFLNVGSKDGLTEIEITAVIRNNTTIPAEDIIAVKVLDTCTFADITSGSTDEMFTLIGTKIGGRKLNIELATGRKNTDEKRPSDRSFGDKERKPYKKNYGDDRKPAVVKPSAEGETAAEKSYPDGARKPFKKPYAGDERKPFKKGDSNADTSTFKKSYAGAGDKKPYRKNFGNGDKK